MRLVKEEIFGPLAPVFKFKTEEEVVDISNDCEVGLAAYVFTQDVNRAARVTETLQFGMVGVNTGVISDAAAP
jgi:succinate-semialdehyde dehydrogenase/glutarate-semialdehyde dehydrogenase